MLGATGVFTGYLVPPLLAPLSHVPIPHFTPSIPDVNQGIPGSHECLLPPLFSTPFHPFVLKPTISPFLLFSPSLPDVDFDIPYSSSC